MDWLDPAFREKPSFSPYKEVQILQLGRQDDVDPGRCDFSTLEDAWKSYGYAIRTVYYEAHCETTVVTYQDEELPDALEAKKSSVEQIV